MQEIGVICVLNREFRYYTAQSKGEFVHLRPFL